MIPVFARPKKSNKKLKTGMLFHLNHGDLSSEHHYPPICEKRNCYYYVFTIIIKNIWGEDKVNELWIHHSSIFDVLNYLIKENLKKRKEKRKKETEIIK